MKKITYFLSMLVIGTAFLATSCVKNDEPAGLEEMRKGKAALLSAQATVQSAEAEIKKAQALCWTADARLKSAVAEAQEITNKLNSETNTLKIEELKAQQAEILEVAKKALLDAQAATAASQGEYLKAIAELNVTMITGVTGIYQTELEKIVNSGNPSLKSVIAAMATAQADIAKSQANILLYTTADMPAITRKLNNEIPVKELALESAQEILSYLESMPKADMGTLRADLASVKAEINTTLAKVEALKVEKGKLVAENAPLNKAAAVIGEKISGIKSTNPVTGVVVPKQVLTLAIDPAIETAFKDLGGDATKVPYNNAGNSAVDVINGNYVYSVAGLQPMKNNTATLVSTLNGQVISSNDAANLDLAITAQTAAATKAATDLTAANTKLKTTREAYEAAMKAQYPSFTWTASFPTAESASHKAVRDAFAAYKAAADAGGAGATEKATLAAALKTYATTLNDLTGQTIYPGVDADATIVSGTKTVTNDLITAMTVTQSNIAATVNALAETIYNNGTQEGVFANAAAEPITLVSIIAGGKGKAYRDAVIDLYGATAFGAFNGKMIYLLAELGSGDIAMDYTIGSGMTQGITTSTTAKSISIYDGTGSAVAVASGTTVGGKYTNAFTTAQYKDQLTSLKANQAVWAALAVEAKTKIDANTAALKAAQAEKLVADAAYNTAKSAEDLIDAKVAEYGAIGTVGTILYDLKTVADLYQANIDAISNGSTGINDQIQNAIDAQLLKVEAAQVALEKAQANLAAWKEHGMDNSSGTLIANYIKAEEAKIAEAKEILAERQTQFDALTAQKDAIIALIKNQK